MNNLIAFLNTFLSYILLMVIIAAVAAVAIYIGTKVWKVKPKTEEADGSEAKE